MKPADKSTEYFRIREAQERALVETAATEEARQAHLELAERYRKLAEESESVD